jgi:hypothetical protein
LIPIEGSGMSSSHRPRSARALTNAFIRRPPDYNEECTA